MSGLIAALPIQLRTLTDPSQVPDPGRSPRSRLVRYGYVLIDRVKNTSMTPHLRAAQHIPFEKPVRISAEVTWELTCRTNGRGFLIPWQVRATTPVTETSADLDRRPPLLFPLGVEFNLWWCETEDVLRSVLDVSRKRVHQEAQLFQLSTMVASGAERTLTTLLADLRPDYTQMTVKSHEELRKRVAGLIVKEPQSYKRIPLDIEVNMTPIGGASKSPEQCRPEDSLPGDGVRVSILPQFTLVDRHLPYALELARRIIQTAELLEANRVQEDVVALAQFLRVLETADASASSIISGARAEERQDRRYSSHLQLLGSLYHKVECAIHDLGRRLEKIFARAVDEAIWHSEREAGTEHCVLLFQALGLHQSKELWQLISQTDDAGLQRIHQILQGRGGLQSPGIYELFSKLSDWMDLLKPPAEAIGRATNWIEMQTRGLRKLGKQQFALAATRIVNLIRQFEKDKSPLKLPFDQPREALPSNPRIRILATRRLIGQVSERVGGVLGVITVLSAIGEAATDAEADGLKASRNYLQTAGAGAEITTYLGIKSTLLKRFAGGAALVVEGYDAFEAYRDNDARGFAGHTLLAASAAVMLYTAGTGWLLAAGIALVGAALVLWPYEEQEEYVKTYRKAHLPLSRKRVAEMERHFAETAALCARADAYFKSELQILVVSSADRLPSASPLTLTA